MKLLLLFVVGGLALVGGVWWIVARLSDESDETYVEPNGRTWRAR